MDFYSIFPIWPLIGQNLNTRSPGLYKCGTSIHITAFSYACLVLCYFIY